MNDYQKTLTINKPASEVYNAVTLHIADWWSNDLSGAAANAGDSFTIAFGKTQKTFEILEVEPNKKVTWLCVKAYINMAALTNKSEWEGSKIYFNISEDGEGTTLHFLHEGLNQSFECYDVCENGWNYFLASLQAYIQTGKGSPNIKKEAVAVS